MTTSQTEPQVLVPASLPLARKAVEKRRLPYLGGDTMLLDFRERVMGVCGDGRFGLRLGID